MHFSATGLSQPQARAIYRLGIDFHGLVQIHQHRPLIGLVLRQLLIRRQRPKRHAVLDRAA